MFRSLADVHASEIERFAAGTTNPDRWRTDLAQCFAEGTLRPRWCWTAHDQAGVLRAANYWWSRPGREKPHQFVSAERRDVEAALALLEHSRHVLGLSHATAILSTAADNPCGVEGAHPEYTELLHRAGFVLDVQRVGLRRSATAPSPSGAGVLRFRPAAELSRDELVGLIIRVVDGSLDHRMQMGANTHGADAHAAAMTEDFAAYAGPPEWFAVGIAPDGSPAGYVLVTTIDGRAILAELGVAREHRGRRYSSELLTHGTRLLTEAGHNEIHAHTDIANRPMRAAFSAAGFVESQVRHDYVWSTSDS